MDVKLEITSENQRAAAALKQNSEALQGYLSEAGYNAEDITFKENNTVTDTNAEEATVTRENRNPTSEFEVRV
jgi:hypothetical protein